MKKKIVLITFMLMISVGLMLLSKNIQLNQTTNQEAVISNQVSSVEKPGIGTGENKEVDTTKVQAASSQNSIEEEKTEEITKRNAESQKTATSSNTTKPQTKTTPVQTPNLIITDSVSGKTILSKAVVFNAETVAQATTKALDSAKISYKTSTFGDAIYFSSINGIKERSAGPSSGWCYYVNGKKLNVGSGSFKLNKGDKLEWKFLKDGLAN